MLEARAGEQAERLAEELRGRRPGLLESHPVETYLAAFAETDRRFGYRAVPASARESARAIEAGHGEEALHQYNRLALCTAASRFGERCRDGGIPEEVEELTRPFLTDVLAAAESRSGGRYRMEVDRFAKEFAVARLKMVVGGPELIDLRSAIPRRSLVHPPRSRIPARLLFVFRRAGGLAPFLESHLDRRLVRAFSRTGYDAFYRRLALILEARADLRGYVGPGAWYCDPALASISPELGYLAEVPAQNGAGLFPVPATDVSTRDALRLSPARLAAYEAGKYVPRPHMVVWPRESLIAWAADGRAG